MAHDLNKFKGRLGEIETWLKTELATIRTGRANAALLDGVRVESYGSQLPIVQVAGVGSEDARTLRITPYDKSQSKAIEKAIADADLGVSVNVDDGGLRVIFPELTAERRDLLIKQAHKKLEEARISIRNERDYIWGEIQKEEQAGEISEDDKFRAKDEMQKIVDDVQKRLDEITDAKEKEISS